MSGVELSRAVLSRTERSLGEEPWRVQPCRPTSSPRPRQPPIGGGNTRAGRESLRTPNDLRGETQGSASQVRDGVVQIERPEKALPAPKVVPGFHECGYSVDNLGLGTGGAGWHWPEWDADAWPLV